jgi:hypothetical protein
LPIDQLALFSAFLCPDLRNPLRHELWGLAHHLHTLAQDFLGPPRMPLPSYPASSQRCFKRESAGRADRSSSLNPSWSGTFALCTLTFRSKPSVSTSRWRFLPRTFLLPSYPRASPPTPVVLVVWESAMPGLDSGALPKRARNSLRRAALSRSKVPSLRHFLNQS